MCNYFAMHTWEMSRNQLGNEPGAATPKPNLLIADKLHAHTTALQNMEFFTKGRSSNNPISTCNLPHDQQENQQLAQQQQWLLSATFSADVHVTFPMQL